jgi:hypothetical protein
MARKTKAPRPPRADRAAEQADYAAWKTEALADLANRHAVRAGIIPERYGDGCISKARRLMMPRTGRQ